MKNLLTLALIALSLNGSAIAGSGGPDAFGYTWKDSAAGDGPDYEWVDLTEGELVLDASYGTPGRVVPVVGPIVFYGEVEDQVMMVSKNGYVTFDVADLGDDPTNDCPFPAVPNKDSARRIAVLHDNLDFKDGVLASPKGRIEQQYFPTSPHPHHSCGVTVISWLNMVHAGSSQAFDFQLLIFDNFDILMQFGENPENGSGSTTGLQQSGTAGLAVACDSAGSIPDNYAVLFEPPTVVVNSLLDDTSAAVTTLRSALLSAPAGGKIVFDPALSGGSILRDKTRMALGLDRTDPISLDASALSGGLKIDGDDEVVPYFIEAVTHLSNLSFLNGMHTQINNIGGVKVVNSSSATISNCRFEGNVSAPSILGAGGGLRVEVGCSARVYGSLFLRNSAVFGAGINVAAEAELVAVDCEFRFNTASDSGGGIHNQGVATVIGCEFSDNSANFGGGMSYFHEADEIEVLKTNTFIDSCAFYSNEGFIAGGGLRVGGGAGETPLISVTSTTFSFNESPSGAAVGMDLGVATITHSTFHEDERAITADGDEVVNLGHCVFANSEVGYFLGNGTFASMGYNLAEIDNTLLDHPTDIDGLGDLMLGPLATNGGSVRTHGLRVGSPAINAGDPAITGAPDTDARGFARVFDGRIDVGAYEFAGNLVVTTAVDEEVTPGAGLSLREAVRDIGPGGVVTFDPGLDGATIALVVGRLAISSDLTVDASALANGITIDVGGEQSGVDIFGRPSVSLQNLDVIGADSGRGVIVQTDAVVTMSDCSVRGCTSGEDGAGIVVRTRAELLMEDCVVAGNETTGVDVDGGGIYVNGATLVLRRTTVGNNLSSGDGGGIKVENGGYVELGRCTISNNTAAGSGGGIFTNGSGGEVNNCTISGNVAGSVGGAFYGVNSEYEFGYSTIADNRAGSTAGGIVTAATAAAVGGVRSTFTHCIVAANRLEGTGLLNFRSFDQDAESESGGYNLIDDDSLSNAVATDLEERVAYLAPLGKYGSDLQTHALLAISPAIDAGEPSGDGAPRKDQRGYARIADGRNVGAGRIDIGAHEAAAPVRVATLVDDLDGVAPRSLRDALLDVGDGGRIVFNGSLNGGVIDLSAAAGGQGVQLVVDKSIQIDATRLSDGITISGGDESRVFDITGGADVAMHALRIEDGFTGASADGGGFRIAGNADLLLTHSSVSGNRARDGGAFHISAGASARLVNVTVSGNTAQREGATMKLVGAAASAVVEHCTVADQLLAGSGTVGGFSVGEGRLSLYSTVLSGIAGSYLDADDFSTISTLGYNLADTGSALLGGILIATGDQTGIDPNISTLQDPGGWSKVHRYQAASALRNAGDPEPSLLPVLSATGGVRLVGRMDIGAEERNGRELDSDSDQMPDYWENLYGFDVDDAMDASEDADLDGASNLVEFQNGTNPLRATALPLQPKVVEITGSASGTAHTYYVRTEPGVIYTYQVSPDLEVWSPLVVFDGPLDSNEYIFQLGTSVDRNFVRFALAEEEE